MAVISARGPYVLQGVAVQNIPAGRAVSIVASGTKEIPSVQLAPANTPAGRVFVAICPPDNFPKPAMQGMYQHPVSGFMYAEQATALQGFQDSNVYYKYSPSLYKDVVMLSGWYVQLHRECVVTVYSGNFVDTAGIRVAGATIAVGSDGRWVESSSNVVGTVVSYEPGKLTFVLM